MTSLDLFDVEEEALVEAPTIPLARDVKGAAKLLSRAEGRFLVDYYYTVQGNRMRAKSQIKAASESGEPNQLLDWVAENARVTEGKIKSAMQIWSEEQSVGRWAMSITGIGPVLSAGLYAHIDITKCPYVGHIWRFAGLDATDVWWGREASERMVREVAGSDRLLTAEQVMRIANPAGQDELKFLEAVGKFALFAKPPREPREDGLFPRGDVVGALAARPWNARLKVLCYKIGESFVKVQNNSKDVYGKVYLARKIQEQRKNEAGEFQDQAARALHEKNFGAETQARGWYERGMLSPAHIHARARRYAVKLFLAHWHEVAYFAYYGSLPPMPYVIDRLGHADYLHAPNADQVPGMREALIARDGRY